MEVFFAFGLLILFAILVAIYYYNKIIKLKVHVKEGWSDIMIQLKRRHNLVENLVNTVKGYAKHEASTLEKVVQARNAAKQSEGQDPAAVQTAERGLTMALKGLNINALVESYPDLKANTGFQQLQAELSDIENKIAASRRFYNTTVTSLNTTIQQFPGNLFAGMASATKQEFFEVEEDEKAEVKETPKVNFDEEKKEEAPAPAPAATPAPEAKPAEEAKKEEAPAPAPEAPAEEAKKEEAPAPAPAPETKPEEPKAEEAPKEEPKDEA